MALRSASGRGILFSATVHGAVIAGLCAICGTGRLSEKNMDGILMVALEPLSAGAVAPSDPAPVPPPLPKPATVPVSEEIKQVEAPYPVPDEIPAEEPVAADAPTPSTGVSELVRTAGAEAAAAETTVPVAPTPVEEIPPPTLAVPFIPPALLPHQNLEPDYPFAARRARREGVVLLRVTVSELGKVSEAWISTGCGCDELDQSALVAVKSWNFSPARRGDVPVVSEIELPIRFTLKQR